MTMPMEMMMITVIRSSINAQKENASQAQVAHQQKIGSFRVYVTSKEEFVPFKSTMN